MNEDQVTNPRSNPMANVPWTKFLYCPVVSALGEETAAKETSAGLSMMSSSGVPSICTFVNT